MAIADTIEEIIRQARGVLPGSTFSEEAEQNFRALLQAQFNKLDLVSREEFDAQVEVLRRSREKIDRLEHQVQALIEHDTR